MKIHHFKIIIDATCARIHSLIAENVTWNTPAFYNSGDIIKISIPGKYESTILFLERPGSPTLGVSINILFLIHRAQLNERFGKFSSKLNYPLIQFYQDSGTLILNETVKEHDNTMATNFSSSYTRSWDRVEDKTGQNLLYARRIFCLLCSFCPS